MRIVVLGAAAGGGLPQWNCACENCILARSDSAEVEPQTQSSIAVSGDGIQWAVVNASPDIRFQLQAIPALHPRSLRDSPISSVVLTNGDIDHIAGLLTLREQQPLNIYLTGEIYNILEKNSVFGVLNKDLVGFNIISLDQPFDLVSGIEACFFAVPGKIPLFLETDEVQTDLVGEQTIGVTLRSRMNDAERVVCYIPGCATLNDDIRHRLAYSDAVLFDGTVYNNTEMKDQGAGFKTGQRMGHMSMNGSDGSLAAFADIDIDKKIYIHINNTNPVWQKSSTERRIVESKGWQIAYDGMEIEI